MKGFKVFIILSFFLVTQNLFAETMNVSFVCKKFIGDEELQVGILKLSESNRHNVYIVLTKGNRPTLIAEEVVYQSFYEGNQIYSNGKNIVLIREDFNEDIAQFSYYGETVATPIQALGLKCQNNQSISF